MFSGQSLIFLGIHSGWRGFSNAFPLAARGVALTIKATVAIVATGYLLFGVWYTSLMLKSDGINVAFIFNGQPMKVESTQMYKECVAGIPARMAETSAVIEFLAPHANTKDELAVLELYRRADRSEEGEIAACRRRAIREWK